MTHDEMIAVIQAHKRGETIQVRYKNGTSKWKDDPNPVFQFQTHFYRVKRNPKEWNLAVNSSGTLFLSSTLNGESTGDLKPILVREVIQD